MAAAPQWLVDYYQDVDNLRLEAYVARHTDDAVVHFGNNPPAVGKQQIGEAIGGFFSMIGGLSHEFVNVWEQDGTTILEAVVHYRTKDDQHVAVPSVSLLHRQGDLVDSLRIHIDLAPLFAAMAPSA
jgi:ketosteroid isomerase-like protein